MKPENPLAFDKNGINFSVLVQSPSATGTPLQIVCFFDSNKNQHYEGGTDAVNAHFSGAIAELRSNGTFSGRELETLLITPTQQQIPADQLLLIGLGNPDEVSLKLFEKVGYLIVLEAAKLNVTAFCFAPSLKDAGVSGLAADDVSAALAKGMQHALDTTAILSSKGLMRISVLKKITLLAGAPQAENAFKGLQRFFGN